MVKSGEEGLVISTQRLQNNSRETKVMQVSAIKITTSIHGKGKEFITLFILVLIKTAKFV